MSASRTVFTNVKVVASDRVIEDATVMVENGVIADVLQNHECIDSFDGIRIDGQGYYLSAGFIDLHCHGGGGHDFMDGTPEAFIGACQTHARFGTTTLLPTTLAGDDNDLKKTFEVFNQVKNSKYDGAYMPGLHLEGPYLSVEYKGAQDEKYIRKPTPDDYKRIYDWSEGSIIRWSAAPEFEGTEEFAKFLADKGIIASIAHSAASYEDVLRAFNNGFRLVTHLYSCMSTITRKKGYRIPGVVESVYLIDGLKAELIADGCHLPPALLQLAYKFKGPDNLVLVTDSMRGAGMPDGESILGSLRHGQKVIIEDGVAYLPNREAFAGSVCTADRLVRTMVKKAGITLCDAVKMITETPSEILGMSGSKGRVAKGYDADLVIFDDEIDVKLTMIKGRIVYRSDKMYFKKGESL